MRWIPAAATVALALLLPAAPAVAQTVPPKPAAVSCPVAKIYPDIRTLVTIDLDTAADFEVRLLGYRLLDAARANSLGTVAGALDAKLGGPAEDLRAFLKSSLRLAFLADLRQATTGTLQEAKPRAYAAGSAALATGTVEALLTYLNRGLYVARAADAGPVKLYTDIRTLIPADPDTATVRDLRLAGYRILAAADADALTNLSTVVGAKLGAPTAELRAFYQTGLEQVWATELELPVSRTAAGPESYVFKARNAALATDTAAAYIDFLNRGLYVALASDCKI